LPASSVGRVAHSRSPALHGFWLKQHKVDGHYGRLPVAPNHAALEDLVASLRRTPTRAAATSLAAQDRDHPCSTASPRLRRTIGGGEHVIKHRDGRARGPQQRWFWFP